MSMSPVHEAAAVRAPAAMPGHTLAPGTRLREYEIKGLIGEGTCSIVYLGWDHALERKVAIKEYMPAGIAGRLQGSASVVVASARHVEAVRAGMRGFLNEARVLARFDHPALVKVYRFWEENGTAYMVMPCYEGPTLKATLAELGHVPSETEIRAWLKPILDAVTLLHESATWHQNIGPDEIVMTPFGPVLLGLAGAAHAIEAVHHTPAAALKAGYAAIEQYGSAAGSTRGPWTDLYALGALVYAAITGSEPSPAADRLTEDKLRPLSIVAAGLYSKRFLAAIDAAMAVQPRRRPAHHAEFRALMGDMEAPEAAPSAPAPDLMQEPFAAALPKRREIAVTERAEAAGPTSVAPASVPARLASDPPMPAPVAVAAASPPARADAADDERAAPSWMPATRVPGIGKRALYSVIAGTCALIGIAALVVQFATRPAARVAVPSPTTSTPLVRSQAMPPVPAPAVPPATPAATNAAATTSTPTRTATTSAATTTASARSPATPAPHAATTKARTTPVAAAPAAPTLAATQLEREARCTEILQKASLEKITSAETDFFKRECK
jgi:serine/threonine protein kinase